VRAMLETNVFGTWNMIKAVLPGMRKRARGHIVNISSVGGFTTFPAVGFYHMTTFAVEGLSETLAKEIAPLGLGVTLVEPGAFRTDFRGASMKQSNVRLPAYGVLAVYKAMLPLLRKAPAPRIVNVSSGSGSLTMNSDPTNPHRAVFGPVYSASKTALNALTLAMAI
jgi:NAD(P)-dependent dehydrogenase (short-subunit alcohol dehydrogenase family)